MQESEKVHSRGTFSDLTYQRLGVKGEGKGGLFLDCRYWFKGVPIIQGLTSSMISGLDLIALKYHIPSSGS